MNLDATSALNCAMFFFFVLLKPKTLPEVSNMSKYQWSPCRKSCTFFLSLCPPLWPAARTHTSGWQRRAQSEVFIRDRHKLHNQPVCLSGSNYPLNFKWNVLCIRTRTQSDVKLDARRRTPALCRLSLRKINSLKKSACDTRRATPLKMLRKLNLDASNTEHN